MATAIGGQDNTCRECRRGGFRNCRNLKILGISYDGGYQEYMVAPVETLVPIPETLNNAEAAPLLCGAITTAAQWCIPRRSRGRAGYRRSRSY